MNREPIYITGVGVATPLGNSYPVLAEHLLAGRSGVRRLDLFRVDDHPSQIGAAVTSVPCPDSVAEEAFQPLPKIERGLLWCCTQALRDAGLWERRSDLRVGLVLGNAAEWNSYWENDYIQGGRQAFLPQRHIEPLVQRARQRLALTGPAVSLSAACASGNYALALARRWLRLGWVDVCLAGACDMAITPLTLASFGNLRALSRRNDDPEAASRPFDTARVCARRTAVPNHLYARIRRTAQRSVIIAPVARIMWGRNPCVRRPPWTTSNCESNSTPG